MSYRIIEVDGVQIDPSSGRFPIDMQSSPHAIDGEQHTGVLTDSQIPLNIMRDAEHQSDPHTMIIDGRDVSVDGAKLDGIESGAEVNNLTDQQATSLVSGAHTNWHHHDNYYYRKSNLQTSGESSIHWDNITNTPATYAPSEHNHDSIYYTQTQLDPDALIGNNVLDIRYYTENEVHSNFYTQTQLNNGQLDSRYYTESEIDNLLLSYYTQTQLNSGQLDSRYYTETELDTLLSDKANLIHNHDSVYYTKTQLSPSAALNNNVLDARYFTEGEITTNYYNKTEVDGLIATASYGISGAVDYYADLPATQDTGTIYIVRNGDGTNSEGFYRWDGSTWIWLAHNLGGIYHNDLLGLNAGDYKHLTSTQFTQLTDGAETALHIHDGRYYTQTELDNFLSGKSNIGHIHDDRYYTETEIDSLVLNYYTKDDLDPNVASGSNVLDARYFTETEITTNYYSKAELDSGQLDNRYATETEIATMFSNYYDIIDLDPNAANVGDNVLDTRYYTESEIDNKFTLYFTKNELLNGTLDVRYFTETELTSGSLDGRYYTETEIDTLLGNYYTQTDFTNGVLDGRYYTESENDTLLSEKSDVGHTHNDLYFTKTELSTDSIAEVHWSNLTNTPTEFNPSAHNHDDRYYTETELDNGQLDNRYYTETELDAMIAAAAYGITGSVDLQTNLPTSAETGEIYIVNAETDPDNEGFYRWDGTQWIYLAPNTGATSHNNLNDLNIGDYMHLTSAEYTTLTTSVDASSLHNHDLQYYTQLQVDNFLSSKSDTGHTHDGRYYTEAEIDSFLTDYYTQTQLDNGQLDNRYFTETEITTNYYTKTDLNNGQLNNLYYTETEIDDLISNKSNIGHIHDDRYYTETETNYLLDGKSDTTHNHDSRYYTKTNTDTLLAGKADAVHDHNDLYFTETELNPLAALGENVLDARYFTESEINNNFYTQTQFSNGVLDNRYYTESEVDIFLANKAESVHNHDNLYYTKIALDSTFDLYYTKINLENGALDSRYFTETEITTNYYTKTDLNNGALDIRYYTENEIDSLIAGIEAYGIKGGVDYYTDLPGSPSNGDVYIVRLSDETNEEGFYKWDGINWIFIANNTGATDHNNLSGLNSGDYMHLTSTEYGELTNGSDTSLHSHNNIYYTETEMNTLLANKSDINHSHDDRYYTETELDILLANKSDTTHNHDDRYYTETEINNLLSNYYTKTQLDPIAALGDNVLDSRYYTETEIQTNYYTKSNLDAGQLDNRYYTETEINNLLTGKSDTGHTHDDRYYTEIELDGFLANKSDTSHTHNDLYYTESEVDTLLSSKSDTNHIHDDRYYTEVELNSASGASFIGISPISGITSGNIQGALEELSTSIGSSASTLQGAYNGGNTISVSDTNGPVKITGGATPPLELSNQSTAPTQNINGGSLAVINNELYIYDAGRSKWLTPSKIFTWGDKVADGGVMTIDEVGSLNSGYNMNKQGTIIGMSLTNVDPTVGKDVNIMINGTTVQTLTTNSEYKINNNSLNVDFNQGDVINIYVESPGAALKEAVATLEICWRA